MLCFNNDYMRGAHPEILQRLIDSNMVQSVGYGLDSFTAEAERKILALCGLEDAKVYFLTGGTQSNTVMIDAMLTHCQSVLATDDAHINVHEAGAIEATGHKVVALPGHDGKLDAKSVAGYIDDFYQDPTWQHKSIPGMAYISHPTELGTLYSLRELESLAEVCRSRNIKLYLDGARLIYALASPDNDVTLADIARLCDSFYIGGTKAGTLFGEAVVIKHPSQYPHIFSLIKQHGGLMAKGRLAGIQFDAMFSNGLYRRIGENAIRLAGRIRNAFLAKGWKPFTQSSTNQQIFTVPNRALREIDRFATYDVWGSPGAEETTVRFTTDWSTSETEVNELLRQIADIQARAGKET